MRMTVTPDNKAKYSHTSSNTTNHINLEESESTLLEVQIETSDSTEEYILEYQWFIGCCNHMLQLMEVIPTTYSGITSPSLCITEADIDMDGEFFVSSS